jgi:hypothetical protein
MQCLLSLTGLVEKAKLLLKAVQKAKAKLKVHELYTISMSSVYDTWYVLSCLLLVHSCKHALFGRH